MATNLSRESIEAAISESDRVGADKFLLDYGRRGLTGPILRHEGQALDAIAVVTYARQQSVDEKDSLPEEIDLREDIIKPLRRAGFVVREHPSAKPRFWWVNQDKTREEFEADFMWSPLTRKDGTSTPNYEFMSETSPGDLVVSYWASNLQGYGFVTNEPEVAPKPAYREAESWATIGWYVQVEFEPFESPFTPKDHIASIGPLLAEKNAPLQKDGRGREFYLTEISEDLASLLLKLGGVTWSSAETSTSKDEPEKVRESYRPDELLDDQHQSDLTKNRAPLEVKQLVNARRGQGRFKRNLQAIEKACRITGTKKIGHLIASHIRPWRLSNDHQKLDGNNGLLLAPHVDHLFNSGWISFDSDGTMLCSKHLSKEVLDKWSIPHTKNVGAFNDNQAAYLEFHRKYIYKG